MQFKLEPIGGPDDRHRKMSQTLVDVENNRLAQLQKQGMLGYMLILVKTRVPGFIFSFSSMFLGLRHVEGSLPADLCLVTLLINLGTMFAMLMIPPATRSSGKQNIQHKKKLIGHNAELSTVNLNTL